MVNGQFCFASEFKLTGKLTIDSQKLTIDIQSKS